MVLSVVLGGLARWSAPIWTIFAIQLGIGIANTVQAPAFNASLPSLVPRADIGGAVSLNSAMINGSRIAGPALAHSSMDRSRPLATLPHQCRYLLLHHGSSCEESLCHRLTA